MKIVPKSICYFFFAFILTQSFVACSNDDTDDETETIDNGNVDTPDNVDFTTNTKDTVFINQVVIKYISNDVVEITNPFQDKGVLIAQNKGHIIITSSILDIEVNYVLSGNTADGSVKIYSDYKFGLALNGVSIINPNSSAINIQSGKKVSVFLVGGTSNRLIDSDTYTTTSEEDVKATFFSEGQLNFEGNGSLLVKGKSKHAICSDDYIRVKGGTITISAAAKDGIHANDYFRMDGGTLNITATSDGIDCEEGYIAINGGTITINSVSDGIKTSYKGTDTTINPYIAIANGTINIATTGDAGKGIKSKGDLSISGGNISIGTKGNAYYDTAEADISSASGIKCDGNMSTSGDCIITINSSGNGGKGISVDGALVFDNGTVNVTTTGDRYVYNQSNDTAAKAIKSDGNLTVNNGHITIKTSKTEAEGLESKNILTINGGTIEIDAYDDCINATNHIAINGGNVYCNSATNDGIDSNGTLTITGGVVVTSGSNAPEEGLDCDNNTFKITGGLLVGTGGATSSPTSSVCTQRSLIYNGSGTADQLFHIEAADGATILTFKIPRTYSQKMTLLFSSPNLVANTQYTIYTGGSVSGGTSFHGLYSSATYTKGTAADSFTPTSMVTTIGTSSGGGGRP